MKRVLAGLSAALFVAATSPSASANGRFPQANQIAFDAAGGPNLVVRTTFGLMVSHDRGASFHWVCEQVVGYSGVQDPGIGLFADGSIAVAAFEGLSMSHDSGCSWTLANGGLAGEYVIDVAIEPKSPQRGVSITSTGTAGGTFHIQVFETGDGGATWTAAGVPLGTDLLAETIDIAPSDPMRLYVSGTFHDASGTKKGALEVSADRGKSWKRTVLDIPADAAVFIGGVDPSDASRVYLRTRGNGQDGTDGGVVDRLLVSKDGGASVQEVTSVPGPMAGFAISPDGTRVAIGSQAAGLLIAGRDDLAFSKVATKAVQCLAWDGDGLYVCGSDFADGFTIGRTSDEGKTFTALLPKLADIAGPLDTCATDGAYATQCGPVWPMLQQLFGVGTTGGSGGAGGAVSAAGSGGSAGASGSAPAANGDSSSGCGCEIGPGGVSGGGLLALFGIALAGRMFRKRRDIALPPVRKFAFEPMAKPSTFPLDAVRTDGWFERIGEGIGSFQALCEIVGERFVAFSLITGARITALSVDRRNLDGSLVDFVVGGADGGEFDVEPQRLTLAEFRRRLVAALLAEEVHSAAPQRETDLEAVQLHIGVRHLLLAPLYGYSLKTLRVQGDRSELDIAHDGVDEAYELESFRARLRMHVREELERAAQGGRGVIDLSRVAEAETAAERGDHAKVRSLLGAWPAPLAIFLRTPDGQSLAPEARTLIAKALGLLGTACGKLGDGELGEEVFRLAVQYAQDGAIAGDIFRRFGDALLDQQRPGEAIAALRRAVNLGAPGSQVWPLLARAFIARKRYVAAVACLREATAAGALEPAIAEQQRAVESALGPAFTAFRAKTVSVGRLTRVPPAGHALTTPARTPTVASPFEAVPLHPFRVEDRSGDPRMIATYAPLFLLFLLAGLIVVGMFSAGQFIGPKNPTPEKMLPFECGSESAGGSHSKLSVKFYLTAILFVVFDIEAIFIYPWAVTFRELGWVGFLTMLSFLAVLVVGLVYCWKKGALEWET